MTKEEIVLAIKDIIATIGPDEELDGLNHTDPLRDQIELDSMDFLAYVSGVSEALALDVPEDDYDRLDTVNSAIAYVVEKASA